MRPTVLAGDWNLHHSRWDSNATESREAEEVVEWLDSNHLELANVPDVSTYHAHNGGAESVLDLVFFNSAASELDLVKDYHIDLSMVPSSDHDTSRERERNHFY